MDWSGSEARRHPEERQAIAINTATLDALFADLRARMRRGEGFAVATLNLDHVVKLRASGPFRSAYRAHSHIVADGNPIVWLSRLAGQAVSLVPGSDLTMPLAGLAAEEKIPMALVGSTDEVLARAGHGLREANPGLTVALTLAPPFGFDPAGPGGDAVIERIRASGARLCFLALGAPKQEILAARAFEALPGVGFVSVGASLDFLAGAQTRAPGFMRALALEWLWRMMLDPRRLALRYGRCFSVLPGLTAQALRERLNRARRRVEA